KNAFFDEKCSKINGRCMKSCQKNEELVALCQRALKCCVTLQPCERDRDSHLVENASYTESQG
ncbi:beta-defensin 15-like, partial [Nannospalax galili]|uniref:beta-defensin 15-like n=1 Tax=Nannospalax galili TaxID=1026970 RepID=UPI0004ED0A25